MYYHTSKICACIKFIMWFHKVLVYYSYFICADHMFNIYFVLFMIINFVFLRRFKQWTLFLVFVDAASNLLCCVILLVL